MYGCQLARYISTHDYSPRVHRAIVHLDQVAVAVGGQRVLERYLLVRCPYPAGAG